MYIRIGLATLPITWTLFVLSAVPTFLLEWFSFNFNLSASVFEIHVPNKFPLSISVLHKTFLCPILTLTKPRGEYSDSSLWTNWLMLGVIDLKNGSGIMTCPRCRHRLNRLLCLYRRCESLEEFQTLPLHHPLFYT